MSSIFKIPILIALFVFSIGCVGPLSKRPPVYGKIYEKYYVCERSKTLVGGIFGKGPLSQFGENDGSCFRSQWKEIDKQSFKALAKRWYDHDWDKDIPFWHN